MALPELIYNKKPNAARLGELVNMIMETKITPCRTRIDPVAEAWSHIVPPGLRSHCCIQEIKGSTLKVNVDSSTYLYELQLCAQALLQELQSQVPQAGLRYIKLRLGSIE